MGAGEAIGIAAVALGAGVLGTMLGLGGGVFLVPILSLAFGVDLEEAIAASAVAVVANSISGSSVYLRARFTNVRLALVLQVSMVAGAILGGLLAVSLPETALKLAFAALLLTVALLTTSLKTRPVSATPSGAPPVPDALRLAGHYYDPSSDTVVHYVPRKVRAGVPAGALAGIASGLFGIGGGPVIVPLFNLVMRVPFKAATSTSSFMFGLTASASAFIYYTHDAINPSVTAPAVLGVVAGARLGALVVKRVKPRHLRRIFVVVMIGLALAMAFDGLGVY